MSNEIKCNSCGKVYTGSTGYCRYCGEPINITTAKNHKELEGIDIENWKMFIGDNHEKILPIFKKHEGKKFFADFITPAIFFPVQWLLYRKMYKEAVFTQLAAWALFFLFCSLIAVEPAFSFFLTFPVALGIKIILALPCPMFYRNFCKKNLKKDFPDYQRGGTSWAAMYILSYVVEIAVSIGIIILSFAL